MVNEVPARCGVLGQLACSKCASTESRDQRIKTDQAAGRPRLTAVSTASRWIRATAPCEVVQDSGWIA